MSTLSIGAHVEQTDPVAEAKARDTTLVQFFLGDPQGYKGPEIRYARRCRRAARRGREGGRRPLRPRALHRQRRHHQQPDPDPQPQAAPAAHGRGSRDRRQGPDRARRPRQQGRRPGEGLRQLAQGGRGDRHQDPAADREHRRWRQRDGAPPRPDRRRLGRAVRGRGRRAGRLLPRHLPRLGRRHRPRRRRWTRSAGSPAGSTSSTPTTAATRSTPAPTGTPTSASASLPPDEFAGVVREAGAPVICETPGGAAEHRDDFAWLRERL